MDMVDSSIGCMEFQVPVDAKFLPTELQNKIFQSNQFGDSAVLNSNPSDLISSGDITDFQPRVIITEQPQQRGFRFRYECEGPSHGGLQGEHTEKGRKSYPTIKIENYRGPARIVVKLVTDDPIPRQHAHKLVGKNCQNGICVTELKGGNTISFPNLSILHVTRRKAAEVLEGRILDSIRLDKGVQVNDPKAEYVISKDDRERAKKEAQELTKNMQLNVVRLCFQVYLIDDNKEYTRLLPAVVSNPIYDSKSPGASALKICRMDKYGGCCTGNEEVFLLCEKVQKDDVAVKFVEQDKDGNVIWQNNGNFGPLDVHRQVNFLMKLRIYDNVDLQNDEIYLLSQYAIVFKTPPYWNTNITTAVNVLIMLERKTDGEVSEPKAFTYYPQNNDIECIARKKRKKIPLDGSGFNYFGGGGFGGAGNGGGNSSGGDVVGGDGNAGSSLSYRVLLPNGNVVAQTGNLPATVEQAVNEEFQNAPSPCTSDSLEFDLEMDSAHCQLPKKYPDLDPNFSAKEAVSELAKKVEILGLKMAATDVEFSEKVTGLTFSGKVDDSLVFQESKVQFAAISSLESPPPKPFVVESVSEYSRTDEGFSEVSEESAVKEEPHNKQQPKPAQPVCRSSGRHYYVDAQSLTETTTFALQEFAETGDVRHILKIQRQLLTIKNENGDLPIHLAVINNQSRALQNILDVMMTLPNAVKHVNAYNYLWQTALHLAVLTKQSGIIDILLNAGADPTLTDRNGNTPAHLAVKTDSKLCLAMLLKYLRPGVTEINPFPELNFLNYDGYTPSHIAAQNGSVEMLKLLVQGIADINIPDGKSGRTPLHHAVENDDLPVAGYLLMEAGANVNARCYDGNTPLHIACGRGLVGMVALLVTAEADLEAENEEIPEAEEEGIELATVNLQQGRGMKPADYAQDNSQILRVLQGDTFLNGSNGDDEIQEDGVCDTMLKMSAFHPLKRLTQESGLSSMISNETGDLDKLTFCTRMELSKLLDPPQTGQDVYTLAGKLGYSTLISTLEGSQQLDFSATRLLLDYFEASEGTVKRLRDCLLSMNREDAVSKIDAALARSDNKDHRRQLMDQSAMDSGVESMSLGIKMQHSSLS